MIALDSGFVVKMNLLSQIFTKKPSSSPFNPQHSKIFITHSDIASNKSLPRVSRSLSYWRSINADHYQEKNYSFQLYWCTDNVKHRPSHLFVSLETAVFVFATHMLQTQSPLAESGHQAGKVLESVLALHDSAANEIKTTNHHTLKKHWERSWQKKAID